jgi:hypothetical protein
VIRDLMPQGAVDLGLHGPARPAFSGVKTQISNAITATTSTSEPRFLNQCDTASDLGNGRQIRKENLLIAVQKHH